MLPLLTLGFLLGAILGRLLPGCEALRLPAVLGLLDNGLEICSVLTGVCTPEESADSWMSSSVSVARGEGWGGAEEVMARPPKAWERAGTLGLVSRAGEARSEWGGEWSPSVMPCQQQQRATRETKSLSANEFLHRARVEKESKREDNKTHEERRSTAASEAERAAPRLDELDRPCLDERVKVLLELRVCRKRVLDWVFLCQPQAEPWLVDQQEVSFEGGRTPDRS